MGTCIFTGLEKKHIPLNMTENVTKARNERITSFSKLNYIILKSKSTKFLIITHTVLGVVR